MSPTKMDKKQNLDPEIGRETDKACSISEYRQVRDQTDHRHAQKRRSHRVATPNDRSAKISTRRFGERTLRRRKCPLPSQ
jgi:hypothetical protein